MSSTDVKTMDERTVTPLARVILAFPESSRTPAMVEELERQMAIAHRSDIITGVGEWLRDSGQATDLVGKATSGERPRADENINRVPLPEEDPVYGAGGPLVAYWLSPA